MKNLRQDAIRKLLSTIQVTSQDDLRRKLVRQGFDVTQATLSRDINELRLVKGPDGYSMPGAAAEDEDEPTLEDVLESFGLSVKQAQNLLVLDTTMGSAQPVAAAMDRAEWDGIVGTIAGDDTVLVICPDTRLATATRERLERLIR